MSAWLDKNRPWLTRAQRWRCVHHEPLRLRVWLWSAVVFDEWLGLTIEGAIQHAIVVAETGRAPGDVYVGVTREDVAEIECPIPIEDVEYEGARIARASWAAFPSCAVSTVRKIRKRTDVEALRIAGRVQVAGGAYKTLDTAHVTMTSPFVEFFVRGDRVKLEAIVPSINALGFLRADGLGTVRGIDVMDDDRDRSLVLDGAPQRALPLGLCKLENGKYDTRPATTRHPYWEQSSARACAMPLGRLAS